MMGEVLGGTPRNEPKKKVGSAAAAERESKMADQRRVNLLATVAESYQAIIVTKTVILVIFIIKISKQMGKMQKANATGKLMTPPPPQSTSKILQNPVQRRQVGTKTQRVDYILTILHMLSESNSVGSCNLISYQSHDFYSCSS